MACVIVCLLNMHQIVVLIPLTTPNKKENVIAEGILDKTCRFVLNIKVNTNILDKHLYYAWI